MTRRDERIAYMVPSSVKQELERLAEQTGMSVSEIARRGMVEEMQNLKRMCNRAETSA